MEKITVNSQIINDIAKIAPHLLNFPKKRMWIDYDNDADVLYISFKKPQQATNSEMSEDGILLRYTGEDIVGVTILDASRR
ncbi:MAG: DUF2283 domain-containing protein [Candidatus Acididesulfobacter diazotrophicus]|jgi:uncharacterized protein YuzE|uniref:DUF2283 domain-containing protein n=1 Tax=Candidatus Acididesulfobacter diazotrophicus TaxID=2597226 RepID=A0A519BN14_9DELT|nr:MAG: DUF2283 domain-containing protein [Candidatus Acididesulfobacter diazotrophicus]